MSPTKTEDRQSDFMEQWLSIPKAKRERFTKRQIAFFNKPDLASDALGVMEVRAKKSKGTVVIEEAAS